MKDKKKKNESRIKLIYNPKAGDKRRLVSGESPVTLEDIKNLFTQYQLIVDYYPTKRPKHATELAKNAAKEGYKIVIAAGGDGTVAEVANGLVHTDIILGILPLGSFMNTARMLAVPQDLEKAVMLIKLGRVRKIDVGSITKLSGEKMDEPYYFLESAGIGLEAQLHRNIRDWENGSLKALVKIAKTFFDFYGHKGKIYIDGKEYITKATVVNIANGPYSGASIPVAPNAKLNDHKLTIRFYRMNKFELIKYFLTVIRTKKVFSSKIETHQAKTIKIETQVEKLVHADASIFGKTPVEFKIIPNALSVISGFPKTIQENAFKRRTYLDL